MNVIQIYIYYIHMYIYDIHIHIQKKTGKTSTNKKKTFKALKSHIFFALKRTEQIKGAGIYIYVYMYS